MRLRQFAAILTLLVAGFNLKAIGFEEGGDKKKSGKDSTEIYMPEENGLTAGVNKAKLNILASEINPNTDKVARWDTAYITMYKFDISVFWDTLDYVLHDPEMGITYTVPHQGRITSGFGYRRLYGRKFHFGLDIDLETGDEVVASMEGRVRIARYNSGYGNFVVICHEGGLETLYGHMSELKVQEGDYVTSGQLIGLGGSTGQSTGSHLHYEMRFFGEQINPLLALDPATLMPRESTIRVDPSWFKHMDSGEEIPYHLVAKDETLDDICAMYELDKKHLCEINNISPDEILAEGTKLKLD